MEPAPSTTAMWKSAHFPFEQDGMLALRNGGRSSDQERARSTFIFFKQQALERSMELATVNALLELGKKLFEPLRQYAKRKSEDQEKIALFCDRIAECLALMADAASEGKPLETLSGELDTYMDSLMDLLTGLVPHWRLKEFSEKLNKATIQGTLLKELRGAEGRVKAIGIIREASGSFRGLSTVLRLTRTA